IRKRQAFIQQARETRSVQKNGVQGTQSPAKRKTCKKTCKKKACEKTNRRVYSAGRPQQSCRIFHASSAVSTYWNSSMSRGEMVPSSTSASKFTTRFQKVLPNSSTGMGFILPVWIRVSASNS